MVPAGGAAAAALDETARAARPLPPRRRSFAVPQRDEIVTLPLATPFSVGHVNCYVLRGDPLTLVDPGPNWAQARNALVAGLAARQLRLSDIELVLVTHQHLDHAGLAGVIQEESGCVVAAHAGIAGYLGDMAAAQEREDAYQAELLRLHGVPPTVVERLVAVSRTFHRYGASARVERPLADGDTLAAGGRLLTALTRPGHSPSDTIFVDERERTAFVGDHLLPRIFSIPVAHRALEGDRDARRRAPTLPVYLGSLDATARLDLDLVHPGHGEAVRDHVSLVEQRVARHRSRTEGVLRTLRSGPQTAFEVARAMWREVADRETYLTVSEVLGALDCLLDSGDVVELHDLGAGLVRYGVA